MNYTKILQEYLDTGIINRMIENGYALYPAKSAGYAGRHGTDYHIDMSIRTHVLNGLFPVTRLLSYLDTQGIYTMREDMFRRLLVCFTTHDFHKDPDAVSAKGTRGEFDVPLAEVEREIDALGIRDFVQTTGAEHRVTMIHKSSGKVGDYGDARSDNSILEPWIHVADALSSIQSAREFASIKNYLRTTLTRQISKHPLEFYWHELDDYRGLSTLLIHQATTAVLEEQFALFPLLYFPNGVLYISPDQRIKADAGELRKKIAEVFFQAVQASSAAKSLAIAQGAVRLTQSVKFEKYAFIFAGVGDLIQSLRILATRYQHKQFLTTRFGKRLSGQAQRKGHNFTERDIRQFVKKFCEPFHIPSETQEDDDFSAKWSVTAHFIMGMENLADALVGESESLEWLFKTLDMPATIQKALTSPLKEFANAYRPFNAPRKTNQRKKEGTTASTPMEEFRGAGGTGDHCVILAYHYLVNHTFGDGQRSASAADLDVILHDLTHLTATALAPYDSVERRLAFVNDELGLEADIARYLGDNLVFSFDQARQVTSPLTEYAKARTRSHGRLCLICNREIPKEMSDSKIKTKIAETQALVFSDRILPAEKVGGQMRWCPICYLEFMLRRLADLGYANGADTNSSDRLYLYLLPDYSFTPEFWEYARHKLLEPFESVTKFSLRRDYGDPFDVPTTPNQWLLHRKVDTEWLEEMRRLFERAAEKMAVVNEKLGKSSRELPGEKMKIVPVRSPNYQVLVYENSVSARFKDRAPTRSEMWAKATYAATLLHLLLGVRVYVTDKPYLPLTRPDEMKHIVQLDGAHSLIRNVLPENTTNAPRGTVIQLTQLERAIDLLSAIWEVNAALSGGTGNLDKQVAGILELVNTEPLAGAHFYKERERDEHAVYPALLTACEILLTLRGGDKLNLAERITNASLDLFLPLSKKEGKAHRYETMFRTAVEVIKTNLSSDDSELEQKVAGNLLKRLGRIEGGAVSAYGDELAKRANNLAHLVVHDLFRVRCGGRTARLTHEENSLADAIYYMTDRQLGERWKQYKAAQAARKEKRNEAK